MAHLLPKVDVDSISHASERMVAKALLEGLNDEWMVYHSYPWLHELETRRGALGEGEADFVILHPKFGLLILEVKGGTVDFDPSSGLWFQSGRPMKESPFEQARRNLHALLKRMDVGGLSHFGGKYPGTYGYAVAFPHCRTENQPPPGADPQVIADADDMPRLGDKVQKALRAWHGEYPAKAMDSATFKQVKAAILSNFRLIPSLARTLESEGEALVRMTEDQTRVIEGLAENDRVAIEGVAGSGKTLLALHQAGRWAQQGKKTLMLCFNRNLAEELQRRVAQDNLTIRHFHGLAQEICKRAKIDCPVPTDPHKRSHYWNEELPELAGEALEDHPELQYDAVIVDEAQDFELSFWLTVECMLSASQGPLYYFYDRAQALYRENPDFPRASARFRLTTNCRNTRAIATACSNVIQEKADCLWSAPPGVNPSVELVKKTTDMEGRVEKLLTEFLREEKLSPSQVAILRPFKESSVPTDKIGAYALTSELARWHQGKAVWSSTIRAFKGLESDILILVDVPSVGERHFALCDLYVACSRARMRLIIFTTSSDLRQHLLETKT